MVRVHDIGGVRGLRLKWNMRLKKRIDLVPDEPGGRTGPGRRYTMYGNMPDQGAVDNSQFYAQPVQSMATHSASDVLNDGREKECPDYLDDPKKHLAKRANKIYRSVCNELGLQDCFFKGFNAWSEFVDGKMSETSFYELAKEEASDIASKQDTSR